MLITRIELRNVRGLQHRVLDLAKGLTVIYGQNDSGKSTAAEALRAAFTLPARSAAQEVRVLQARGTDLLPEVNVQFEQGGVCCTLRKRFGARGETSLELRHPNGTCEELHSDSAELKLREMMGLDPARRGRKGAGLFPLFFVEQGKTTSAPAEDLDEQARGTLAARLSAQAGVPLSGPGDERLLEAARAESSRFYSTGGQFLRSAGSEPAQVTSELASARMSVDELERKAREIMELADRHAAAQAKRLHAEQSLPSLRSDFTRAQQAAQQLKDLRADVERAKTELDGAELSRNVASNVSEERFARRKALADDDGALTQAKTKAQQAIALAHALGEKRPALAEAAATAVTRIGSLANDEARLSAAVELRRAQVDARKIETALDTARGCQSSLVELRAHAATLNVGAAAVKELQALERAAEKTASTVTGASARVVVRADRACTLGISGEEHHFAAGESTERVAAEAIEIALPGLVTVRIEPGGGAVAELRRAAQHADDALQRELAALGVPSVAAALGVEQERGRIEQQIVLRQHELGLVAPAGVAALDQELATVRHAEVAARARFEAAGGGAITPHVEQDLQSVRLALLAARAERQRADDALGAHDKAAGQRHVDTKVAEVERRNAETRLRDREAALQRHISKYGDDLRVAAVLESAQGAWAAHERDYKARADQLQAQKPDEVEARVVRTQRAVESTEAEVRKAEIDVAQLEALLEEAAGIGLNEKLDTARARLDAAQRADRLLREQAAAAKLLADTLEAKRRELREALLRPLLRKAQPFLDVLFPGAALQMDEQFALNEVNRGRGAEPFDELGFGSREQLGIVLRLGLARLLSEDDPVPVLLDDPLGWTDPMRRIAMADMLQMAARKLQLIIFTCDWERHRMLGADVAIDLNDVTLARVA